MVGLSLGIVRFFWVFCGGGSQLCAEYARA